jgi:hypothetical protein
MIKIKNQDELDAFILKYNATWPGRDGASNAMVQINEQIEERGYLPLTQIQIIKNDLERLDRNGKHAWQIVMFVVQLELVDD